MPFTFSHPAAAVPFRRSRLMLSGLVIGSMAPDFQYFLHWTGQGRDAHTYPGIVLFTIPAAVLMFAIFHLLLKWPLVSLFPVEAQKRLVEPAMGLRWNGVFTAVVAAVSLLAGIVTHLAWDAFTHADGWIVQQWPALHQPLFFVGRTAIQPFKIAQHGSTALGLLILFVWTWQWYRRAEACTRTLPPGLSTRGKAAVLGAIGVTTVGIATAVAISHADGAVDLPWLQRVVGSFVVSSITVAFACVVAYSAAWWGWIQRTNRSWRSQRVMRAVSAR